MSAGESRGAATLIVAQRWLAGLESACRAHRRFPAGHRLREESLRSLHDTLGLAGGTPVLLRFDQNRALCADHEIYRDREGEPLVALLTQAGATGLELAAAPSLEQLRTWVGVLATTRRERNDDGQALLAGLRAAAASGLQLLFGPAPVDPAPRTARVRTRLGSGREPELHPDQRARIATWIEHELAQEPLIGAGNRLLAGLAAAPDPAAAFVLHAGIRHGLRTALARQDAHAVTAFLDACDRSPALGPADLAEFEDLVLAAADADWLARLVATQEPRQLQALAALVIRVGALLPAALACPAVQATPGLLQAIEALAGLAPGS